MSSSGQSREISWCWKYEQKILILNYKHVYNQVFLANLNIYTNLITCPLQHVSVICLAKNKFENSKNTISYTHTIVGHLQAHNCCAHAIVCVWSVQQYTPQSMYTGHHFSAFLVHDGILLIKYPITNSMRSIKVEWKKYSLI